MQNRVTLVDKILERKGIKKDSLKKERIPFEWKEMDNVVEKVAEEVIINYEDVSVGILYDVDADGIFSGYILEDYLTRRGINVKRFMNKQKKHGLVAESIKWVEEEKFDWLFIVDGGSGDGKAINRLTKQGTKVVVLDHHPYERTQIDNTKSWILNVTDSDDLPKLSGCGVVYRFVEKLGELFEDLTGQYEKFVGITVLSDMCDMTVPENRYYVKRAYEEYRGNRFLQQFSYYGSGRSFYSYTVIPYINACIRVGEEKHIMEMINNMDSIAKMNKIERDRNRVLTKQRILVEELLESSKKIVLDDIVLLLRKGREDLRTVGGLLANQLLKEHQRPVLVLSRDRTKWVGSFRGNYFDRHTLEDYKFKTMGHDKACGIEVDNNILKEFRGSFTFKGEKEVIKPTLSVTKDRLYEYQWRDIAEFNEFAGTNLPSILVRFKEGMSGVDKVVKHEYGNKQDILIGEHVITDFTHKEDDTLIVEPILKGTSFQLVRV